MYFIKIVLQSATHFSYLF